MPGSKRTDSGRTISGAREPPIGVVLEPESYVIIRKIGEGPYSDIYLADDLHLGMRVVLKHLRGHPLPELKQRFEREAAVLRKVIHENVVRMLGYFILKDYGHFIAMEYLEGERLDEYVDRMCPMGKQLPLETVLHIEEKLLEALKAIHEKSFVHRDVKPQNVMVIGGREPLPGIKLMDFGVAKVLGGEAPGFHPRLTLGRVRVGKSLQIGSPEFMAPEQIRSTTQGEVNQTADIYAAGIMLYYLLVGEPPFAADPDDARGVYSIMRKHVEDAPPDIRELRPETPEDLIRAFETATAKKQAERFLSAEEFLSVIHEVQDLPLPLVVKKPRSRRGDDMARPRKSMHPPRALEGRTTKWPMPFRKP